MSRILLTGKNQITQSYQSHCNKVKNGLGWAKGVDVVKQSNQTDYIVCHTDGKVIKVVDWVKGNEQDGDSPSMGYGNYVMVLHTNNLVTLYAHLKSVNVVTGQLIKAHQKIGYMGNTGNSFGSHVHFELRRYYAAPDKKSLHDTSKYEWLNSQLFIDSDLPTPVSPDTPEDYSKSTIPDRFKVCVDGEQHGSFTKYDYAVKFADGINGYIVDSLNGKTIYNAKSNEAPKQELNNKSYPNYTDGKSCYRVRLSYNDSKSSMGSFALWENAYNTWLKCKDRKYHIYDNTGKQLD